MADCRDLESLFAAYVDGEAAPGDCAVIDAHFLSCAACRHRVAEERVVRTAVAARREALRGCATGDLRRRCEERCQALAEPPRAASPGARGVFQRKTWVPLSMVATLVLAVAGVFIYGLRDGVEALGAQLAADHVKCFEFSSPPTILPDAKAIGRKWAEDRGWAVKVPHSEPLEQLELLELRRCISTQGTTAHVMYKWRGRPLSVYVLNSPHPGVGAVPQHVERFGQEELIWSQGGRTYAIVTRGRPEDLEQVARYVQRTAE
jgi:anti-sigma factor RsiW